MLPGFKHNLGPGLIGADCSGAASGEDGAYIIVVLPGPSCFSSQVVTRYLPMPRAGGGGGFDVHGDEGGREGWGGGPLEMILNQLAGVQVEETGWKG